jgi:hypothetical protein
MLPNIEPTQFTSDLILLFAECTQTLLPFLNQLKLHKKTLASHSKSFLMFAKNVNQTLCRQYNDQMLLIYQGLGKKN